MGIDVFLKTLEKILKLIAGRGGEKDLPDEEIRSILLVEVTRLGDVLTMLAALRLMQRKFPSRNIHLLVDERYVPLLKDVELGVMIDGIKDSSTVRGFLHGLVTLRKVRFDLVCSMSPAKRNVLLTLGARARFRVGYLTYTSTRIHFLTRSRVQSLGFRVKDSLIYARDHLEDRALKVCAAVGAAGAEQGNDVLRLRNEVYQRLYADLKNSGVMPVRQYVVIHPYSGWEFKSWDISNFCRIANFIVESLGYDVVFVCDLGELHALEIARNLLRNRGGVYFFPSPDLRSTAVLLQSSSLFLGNDSGPLHLAAALGVKIVGLFGPAPPELTAPRGGKGYYLYKKVECSPCEQLQCIRPERPCMALIPIEEVCATVEKALASPGNSTAVENVKS